MHDLISRLDVPDMNVGDMIYRQWAKDAVLGVIPYDEYWKEQVEQAVNALPPAQLEIIRCKECVHVGMTSGTEVHFANATELI